MKICLTIIFNHRYDSNIPRLREIYAERFDCILFLMPFYDGEDSDVIPVYESSYQFQGYLIQAYDKLMETGADYFFFVADDIIINPEINQDNLIESINMKGKDVFFFDFIPVNRKDGYSWIHARFSSRPFLHKSVSWKDSIPSKEKAMTLYKEFCGQEYPEKYVDAFWGTATEKDKMEFINRNGGTLDIPYPLMGSYADLFMISKEKLFSISRSCGVFSAMNLFVEIAIPTAIYLNVKRQQVVTINETGYHHGVFGGDDVRKFEQEYDCNLKKLLEQWNKEWLFVHPVKLSKWKY